MPQPDQRPLPPEFDPPEETVAPRGCWGPLLRVPESVPPLPARSFPVPRPADRWCVAIRAPEILRWYPTKLRSFPGPQKKLELVQCREVEQGAVLHRASREAEGEGNEFGFLVCRDLERGNGTEQGFRSYLCNWVASYPKPYRKASGKSLSSGQHKHSS